MHARQVDGLRFSDFISYVMWLEKYNAAQEEAQRKMDNADASQ